MLAGIFGGVRAYFREMWECRHFWFHLVKCDLQKRYRRSVLGIGWSLAQPLAMALVLTFVYSRVLDMGFWQFGPSLLVGLAFWTAIQQSCVQGCNSFLQAEAYLRQQPLPTAVFPLRVALLAGFHFLMSLLLAAVFGWIGAGRPFLFGLAAVVPVVALLFVLCWSLATIAAYSHVYFPDTQHLLEVGLQLMFYLTPIIYPASLLVANGIGWAVDINPLAQLVQMLRGPLLAGELPSLAGYAWTCLLVSIPAGLAAFLVGRLEGDLIFAM
ncbi:MAG: ABC transporter permease [Gemmataceae bacterium]|nr:ABC transporter permease [Gemmataceae bacterium]